MAVMDEDLESGVRYLLDAVGFDADPDRPISDHTLMQIAVKAARLEAKGAPGFDLDAGPSTTVGGGSIDWQAASGDNWGVRYSPYASGKASQSASGNFSDFLLKLFKSNDASGPAGEGYDSLGNELLGSKDAKGKSSGSRTAL